MSKHESVLDSQLRKFLGNLVTTQKAISMVDCTYGGGNHSKIALELGLDTFSYDQDPNVSPIEHKLLQFEQKNFIDIDRYADIWMADLGMSDIQLNSTRGFSFMNEGLLDMRMNPKEGKPLREIINFMPKYQITDIIKHLGEERNAKKIASNIEIYRMRQKIKTTQQFIEAIGTNNYSILARVFQAFRIYINDELNCLQKLLENMDKYALKAGFIITFHSLEDRIVKNHWKKYKGSYVIDDQEQKKARSAKLRYFIR